MKTLFIVTLLLLTQSLSSSELDWVNEQVDAIKPPRSGVKNSTIARLKNPFIFLHKKGSSKSSKTVKSKGIIPNGAITSSSNKTALKPKIAKRKGLNLDAIMNRSALINGRWYKVNDKIGAYTLSSINGTSVVLSNKKKSIMLSTNSKNLNLKFKNK